MDILLFLLISAASAALLLGLSTAMEGSSEVAGRIRRRLDALSADDPREFLRRRSLGEGASPWLAAILTTGPIRRLNQVIDEAGIQRPTEQLLGFALIAFSAMTAALKLAPRLSLAGSFAVSTLLTIGLPLTAIVWLRRRRQQRIVEQLPDALDMLVRSLRAGHPVPVAIRLVATELPAPIGAEFARVFDSITYGLDLRDALHRMARRVPVPELQYVVSAIRIQHTAGGNLAEILSSLARVMRERLKLYMKVKALSGESRLSAKILGAMPFAVVAIITASNPHFYAAARDNTALAAVLYFAGFLVALGIWLLHRITNIRV